MDELTYEQWFELVDRLVQAAIGLSANDLDDFMYRDAFDDGVRPVTVARELVVRGI